ncbi:hypothetical protein ACN47E_007503 [Coniothyrium glycines]
MSHSWLQRKRKGELLELAQKAHLSDADGLLKDDLVELLETHLNANETTYAKKADFREYYGRHGSPVKQERSSPAEGVAVSKIRRRTLIKEPVEDYTPNKTVTLPSATSLLPERVAQAGALVTRTPRAVPRRVSEVISEVDFPASPAQLAEVADQSFQELKTKATEWWDRSRIDDLKELLRENASSVATIQVLILFIEAAGLQWNTLATTPLFATPASWSWYSTNQYVKGPDAWTLLTAEWWAPATLWSLTSWVLPFVFSYFFNLTLRANTNRKSSDRQYPADPLIFNIIKAILAYSAYRIHVVNPAILGEPGKVFTHDYRWGPFSANSVDVVRNNVPGGYYGLQIGAAVGILVSLYDAALKK